MLIITGTQRSGTTLIAKALLESGYDLGGATWMDEEVQGGLEHKYTCAFYRDYLGDPTFPFDDLVLPQPESGNFATMDYEVIKFCYLLMNPTFVSIWHKFRPRGDVFLVMNREKKDVLRSKGRHANRFRHDSILLPQYVEQLRENFWDSFTLLRQWYPIEVLMFPACTEALWHINTMLARLDPNIQITPQVWRKVYDPSKVHYGLSVAGEN